MLDLLFFDSDRIQWSVRPQNPENYPEERAPGIRFRPFAATRFLQSRRTQNMKCRARRELSIGLNFIKIPQTSEVQIRVERF